MQVACPECSASLSGTPGEEIVCPACMTPFLVPSESRGVRVFDVQPGGDAVWFGMSRHAIREAIYTGRLTAVAKVRHDGGRWELIGGYGEFATVFRLIGGDLAPMAGTRKLAGWRRVTEDTDVSDTPSVSGGRLRAAFDATGPITGGFGGLIETRARPAADDDEDPIPADADPTAADAPPTWAAPFAARPTLSPTPAPVPVPKPAPKAAKPAPAPRAKGPQPPAAPVPSSGRERALLMALGGIVLIAVMYAVFGG